MKLIDRYILRTFLVPLFVTTVAFNLFFIVYDLFGNFDDFVDAGASVKEVLAYYAYLLPPNFWIIMPVVLLLSVLFALYTLTRHNELTAMRASGISLNRLLIPYVLVGALVAGAVAFVDESIGPAYSRAFNDMMLGFKGRNADGEAKGGTSKAIPVVPPSHIKEYVFFLNENTGRDWFIQKIDTREGTNFRCEGIRINKKYLNTQEYEFQIVAESGEYRDGQWLFRDGMVKRYKKGLIPIKRQVFKGEQMYASGFDEPPEVLVNVSLNQEEQFMSSRDTASFLKRGGDNIKPEVQRRLRAGLHSRLARPLGCLIATLLGIPFGFQTARKGIFAGMLICFAAFFSYYMLFIVFMAFSNSGILPAWMGGWMPNIIYLCIGLFLFWRMRQ